MKGFSYFKPDFGRCWIILALLFVGSIAFGGVLGVLGIDNQTLSYAASMLLPFLYIWLKSRDAKARGVEPKPLNNSNFGNLGAAWIFIISAICVLSLGIVLEPATGFIPMPDSIKKVFEEAFVNVILWDGILSTCILAPLCEEFLCRGMMLRGMMAHGRSAKNAILWSAAIFAIMHFNPWQSIPAFVIGAFFGWLYVKTGSLWLTIALHAFNNAFSTLLARLMPDMGVDQGWMDILPTGRFIILYIIALALTAQAIILIYRNYEKTISD